MPENIVGDAATVVILRDAAGPEDGGAVEVLLLERPGRGSFAGAWAFPGGRVDPEDALPDDPQPEADDDASPARAPLAVRRAAVRETLEETGLEIPFDGLVDLSRWVPPQLAQKRLRTWFFVAADPGGEVMLNAGEHVAFLWVAPAVALARHAAGEMVLFPPTWVTLHGLLGAEGSALAIAEAASRSPEVFASVQRIDGEGRIEAVLWSGDAEYPAAGPSAVVSATGRHRLHVASLPWEYERRD